MNQIAQANTRPDLLLWLAGCSGIDNPLIPPEPHSSGRFPDDWMEGTWLAPLCCCAAPPRWTKPTKPASSSRTLYFPNGRNKHQPFVKLRRLPTELAGVPLAGLRGPRPPGRDEGSLQRPQQRRAAHERPRGPEAPGRRAQGGREGPRRTAGPPLHHRRAERLLHLQEAARHHVAAHGARASRADLATKDFMRWTPSPAAGKNTVLPRDTDGAPEEHRGRSEAGQNPRHGASQGHRKHPSGQADGVPQLDFGHFGPAEGPRAGVSGPAAAPPRSRPAPSGPSPPPCGRSRSRTGDRWPPGPASRAPAAAPRRRPPRAPRGRPAR